jgi:hypothetical protein
MAVSIIDVGLRSPSTLYRALTIGDRRTGSAEFLCRLYAGAEIVRTPSDLHGIPMAATPICLRIMRDLVDIVLPAAAHAAAESLGLKVSRSVTSGVRVRRIPREEAEIAVECLRDWGFLARITDPSPEGQDPSSPILRRVA